MKLNLIITVGISGSGKSTWVKSYDNTNYVIISTDMIRKELTNDINNQSLNNEVFNNIAYKRIIVALNAGINVIFDATNLISKYRRDMLTYIKDSVSRDFKSYAKIFDIGPRYVSIGLILILTIILKDRKSHPN